MKTIMNGNSAATLGAALSRVQVIAAYPITPQTSVVEELSSLCASGDLDARFIMVESEHSALACVVGAATAGARAFTATSSQGLLLMHEILHWASGVRVPLVMVNVNRSVAAPWNIWADQTDSLSQRDTGWIQIYCGSAQEVLDSILIGYRVAEAVNVPVMICYDAFYVSHTQEVVDVMDQETADTFLGVKDSAGYVDFDNPAGVGPLTLPEDYVTFRKDLHSSIHLARNAFGEAFEKFEDLTGRRYSFFDLAGSGPCGTLLVSSGALAGNVAVTREILKERGTKADVLNLRVLRPFPAAGFREIAGKYKHIIVIERDLSPGAGGIIFSEVVTNIGAGTAGTKVFNLISGLGGLDVTPEDIADGVERVLADDARGEVYFLEEICGAS